MLQSGTADIFAPAYETVTIDDDLIGTPVRDLQVKALSVRKAAEEGQMTDAVADALFHEEMNVRFRRRREGEEQGATATIDRLMTNYAPIIPASLIVTED